MRAEEAELMSSRVEGGWALICACLRSAADWVAGYLPVVLKLCSNFVPAAVGDVGVLAWQRSMLGAAGALSALTVLAQEHGDMLQALSGPAVTQMRGLLVRALQSDLVTKSAKVAATHGGKGASPAAALLSSVLVDVVKLRVLELVGLVPLTLLPPSVRASVLKRALQVVARAPGKRGATSSLGLDLVHPDDDLLFPVPTVSRVHDIYPVDYVSKSLSDQEAVYRTVSVNPDDDCFFRCPYICTHTRARTHTHTHTHTHTGVRDDDAAGRARGRGGALLAGASCQRRRRFGCALPAAA